MEQVCKALGIVVTGYSPFGVPDLMKGSGGSRGGHAWFVYLLIKNARRSTNLNVRTESPMGCVHSSPLCACGRSGGLLPFVVRMLTCAQHGCPGVCVPRPPSVGAQSLLEEPAVLKVAAARNATAAQVLISWSLAIGVTVNPRTKDEGEQQ